MPTSKKSISIFLFLIVLNLISGCTSFLVPSYTPPTEGPTAKITFWPDAKHSGISIADNATDVCNGLSSGLKRLRLAEGATTFPANRPIFVFWEFSTLGFTQYSCQHALSFTPVEGASYWVKQELNIKNNTCKLTIKRLDSQNDTETPLTTEKPQSISCKSSLLLPL